MGGCRPWPSHARPCPLGVDAYVAAGRECGVPAPGLSFVRRADGVVVGLTWLYAASTRRCREIFVPRERCGCCQVSHALLPGVRAGLAAGYGRDSRRGDRGGGQRAWAGRARPRERAGVPHTTARGWLRRFRTRAAETGVAFAALAVELGGEAIRPAAEASRLAVAAIRGGVQRGGLRCRDGRARACGGSRRR